MLTQDKTLSILYHSFVLTKIGDSDRETEPKNMEDLENFSMKVAKHRTSIIEVITKREGVEFAPSMESSRKKITIDHFKLDKGLNFLSFLPSFLPSSFLLH